MSASFEFRPAEASDYPTLLQIWRNVYGDAVTDDWAEPRPFQKFFLGSQLGVPSFACIVNEFPTLVRGVELKCAGVGAVATLPEARNTGLASFCMNKLHLLCREQGFEIASLYGFRDTFYRKFGYESCGWRWQIKCPTDRLPNLKGELPVRQIMPDDIGELDECYRTFIRGMSGSCLRNSDHWDRRMGKKPPSIYAVGDPVEGYLWANTGGFWNDMEIGEIAWSSKRGYDSLLGLIRGLAVNKSGVIWNEPPKSPFLARFMDSGITAHWHRHTMFRVLNVESVMTKLSEIRPNKPFRLKVIDELIPENEIIFGTTGELLEIPIAAFSQIVMGDPSVETLVKEGQITGDKVAIDALEGVLTEQQVCCMEFF
ncbi:MAG: GNAT family N-acetyltransferase [Fimbriimonadaceae bacterium]|nr:MAG: GNAT family N-acetyltransferase [Fimbriimonadaceae bacterium]